MEAPVNIYLFRNPIGVILDSWYLNPNAPFEKIEYVRTDYAEKVFLRKVNAWLAEIHRVCDITDEKGYRIGLEKLHASFEKYMKG